jgi:hypothetical protein
MSTAGFNWWTIVPTLVGAGISVLTTFIMFKVTQGVEQKKRDSDRRKKEIVGAFVTFWQLKALAEFLGNVDRQLDDAYAEVDDDVTNLEPCDIIKGFLTADEVFPEFRIEDLVFLNRQKRTQVIADIDLLLRRARTVEATVKKYTELRQNLEGMLENLASTVEESETGRPLIAVPADAAAIINLRKGNLNQILAGLHELLEVDVPNSRMLTETFLDLARKEFGSEFPDFKLEWVKNNADP